MASPLDLLSAFSPQTYAIAGGLILLAGVGGFVGGCVHKEHVYADEQIKAVKAGARIQAQDATAGANAGAAFVAKTDAAKTATNQVLGETAGKPLVLVKSQKCPLQVLAKESSPVAKTDISADNKVESVNETSPAVDRVYFNYDFMRLYDTSLGISGRRPALPTGTDEKAATIQADAAIREVVVPNNGQCLAIFTQLSSLIEQIENKQKLYTGSSVSCKGN